LTSPVLKAIGANTERQFKSKGGKKLHRGEKKGGKTKPESNDGVELTMKQLQDLILQNQEGGEDDEQMGIQPVPSPKPEQLIQPIVGPLTPPGKSWKSEVAHQSRNAVVKILSQIIEFDWEHPFKRSDIGEAIGTGFFVSADGIFVTNAHVIEEAAKLWITVPSEGERRFSCEVLGVCYDVDLAVLQSKDAPVSKFLEFGDSNAVVIGQEVLTLGYPLGMDSLKLTEGVISGREENLFQTDAPLNPGNSGGPMLSPEGKVIGINVAIVERSQNVGFAIPAFNLQQLFPSLSTRPKDKRVVHKPLLGADFSNSSDAMQAFFGCKGCTGVYVTAAYKDFPLFNAGVRDGDLLHSFNGFKLDNFGNAEVPWSPYARASLDTLVSLVTVDSEVEIEWSHEGKMQKGKVTFEDKKNPGIPILPAIREYYPPFEKIDYEVISGIVVMDLTVNHITLMHEKNASETVIKLLTPIAASFEERLKPTLIVSDVLVGSMLSRDAVFTAGTLIEEVNGVKVSTLKEFREAVVKPISKDGELYITLKSKGQDFAVLPIKDIFKEEFELSEMYMYQISPLVIKALSHSKEMLDYCVGGDKKMRARFNVALKAIEEQEKEEN
jgi:serine protease Do